MLEFIWHDNIWQKIKTIHDSRILIDGCDYDLLYVFK